MDKFKQFVNKKIVKVEDYISNIVTKKEDELEEIEELINYEQQYKLYNQELQRLDNLFNHDPENTFKYVAYLKHVEEIKFHLKKILELQINQNYAKEQESLEKIKEKIRKNTKACERSI